MSAAQTLLAILLGVVTSTGTPPSHRQPVEIVLVGPEPGRHEMENALRAVLGPAAEVSWSTRDTPFMGASLPPPPPGSSTQLWIDVTNPSQVRIFLPACERSGASTLRTIESPAPEDEAEDEGWKLVARETVAQVVRSAVQVLTGNDGTDASAGAPIAAAEPAATLPLPLRPSADGIGETSCNAELRRLSIATGQVAVVARAGGAFPFAVSPDGTKLAIADSHNLYMKSITP